MCDVLSVIMAVFSLPPFPFFLFSFSFCSETQLVLFSSVTGRIQFWGLCLSAPYLFAQPVCLAFLLSSHILCRTLLMGLVSTAPSCAAMSTTPENVSTCVHFALHVVQPLLSKMLAILPDLI